MKFALFLVLSLSAMAVAGPALIKNNQISEQQQDKQQAYQQVGSDAKSPAIDILKQWCFSSQMSQQELTASFKKLVQVVKSSPVDQTTESAVMSERICQGALVQKSQQTGQTVGQTGADAKAHELIKDVYMDALISCKSRECTEQLLKVISSQQVDTIRASYYMTRIAVSDKQSIKDQQEVKQFAESFIQEQGQQSQSEAVERQKLFATTSLIGKWIQDKPADSEIKEITKQVVKSIVERYIKPVSQQDVEQYEQASSGKQQQQQVSQLAKKIAKRNAALKALANIPGHVLKECQEAEQVCVQLCQNKQELTTVRQSAIECLEQNDKQMDLLKQITFDQQEPIEVRIAAYRALMTVAYQGDEQKNESAKEHLAQQIVDQVVKHCENSRNQQQDEQFVLYAISHLDNVRTSQQPEHQAVKETIAKNKQHYMQIQVLCKKFKQQLSDVRRSSRNYKLEQEFNQLESGLVLEGDIIYESQQQQQKQQQQHILPKLVRVNMSMPIMGETVNVIEVTLRQNNMDEEILSVLKLAQNTKFNSESVSKVVDSFKSSVEKQQQQQQQQRYTSEQEGPVEADLTIKVDGCTVVYLCVDDVKSATSGNTYNQQQQHQRNTRSVHSSNSIVDDVIEFLKRQPVNFNRGFNVNINERLAKVLDVDANILAGLRFESRAQGSASQGEFEIVAKMEPRFSFEAVVGPAKVSSKKLLQRVSTKSALGMRLRFKKNELVDIQLDLPMNTMELFTFETQLVEKTTRSSPFSYNYLPESIYGDEDIYSSYPIYSSSEYTQKLAKRSIYSAKKSGSAGLTSWLTGRKSSRGQFSHSYETSDKVARAVGLRGQLRVVASPQDMGLLVSAIVQKYEPQMEGYRVKVEKLGRQGDLKQYLITVSTPNSRIERTMQVRLVKQSSQQRTLVKADVQSPKMSFGASLECVHDNRQYSIKTELVSRDQSRKQWHHTVEAGYTSGASSSSGRLAQFSYKPYVSIDSSELSRPIQMQGQLAYQQSPKSVISYELKCSTYGDFVQGKIIVDQRDVKSSYQMRKRSPMQYRRSMQSPLELLLSKDLTFTHEMIAQVQEHAVKVHNMIDWDCQKYAIQADSSVLYKDARKQESRVSASAKLDIDQQVFTVERKCPADERKEYSVRVASQVRPSGHQMEVECRHQGRRQSLVAYKHNINAQQVGQNKYDVTMDVELVDTERRVNEKFTGRARVQNERNQKTCQCELASRNKQAKVNVDYQSLAQHQIQLELQCESYQHKTELRNNKRQFAMQSRTDNKQTGQTCAKMVVEINKPEEECKMVLEAPAKRISVAADLKLASGKRSSIAVQTGRFASSAEFSFDTVSRKASPFTTDRYQSIFDLIKPAANLRFRSNLKDIANKQAYWMDSALIGSDSEQQQQSYLRFDSPYYRTDIEFDPRDQETKLAAFARSKRSTNSYDSIYSTKDSSLYDTFASGLSDKLNLGSNKSWMLRSIISSPYAREQLKQQARRALFEYADRRQAHKHSFNYSPAEQRLTMDLFRQPNTEFVSANEFEPVRAKADLSTSWSRPSTMSLESEFMNCDAEIKPFDQYESYAKLSALSRHPRSPFKKHESEYRYKKDQGYKGWMKYVDSEDKKHSLAVESDVSPKKYAKVDFESDKHGKANWEHKWRSQKSQQADDKREAMYENKFAMRSEGPAENRWKHETSFQFEEPIGMVEGKRRYRERRSIQPSVLEQIEEYAENKYGYSPIEYLKHTNARLVSQTSRPNAEQLYKLDFDYKPHQNWARLNVDMPENMLHSSQIELKPAEKLYKLQSKLYNRMTNEPSYEFVASTKPYGLATADQEPVFVDTEHPMFERPISKSSLAYALFKQPMKLDYSDKWGRQANIDYDESPVAVAKSLAAAGLRQKRAAVYYKDNSADFEHSSSYDFYPETYMTSMKPSYYAKKQQQQQQQASDVAFKTETKYGPIVVRADSTDDTCQVDIATPVMNAKLVGETGANLRKLYKLKLDNKSQRVQMSKLLREAPASIRECQLAKKFARKLDSGRFEHQSELLVSMIDQIFKIKSATQFNERPIVVIEGEYNQQQDKAYAKINGERINGQCMVDLVRKTADLIVEVDDKHTMHHVSRMVRTSDKFYSLESMTTYKSRPVLKLIGKVSAQIFDPSHLFARRHYGDKQQQKHRYQHEQQAAHVSTFEAVLYEPQEVHVTGQYDCDQKEARIVFKNVDEKRFQETLVRYDETNETLNIESRLSSADEGTVYATKARLSLPGLSQSEECTDSVSARSASAAELYSKLSTIGPNSCQSEMIYSDKSGNWSAKYQPGEYITVSTPKTKQTINLAGYYYY